jgi:hypothetical protein
LNRAPTSRRRTLAISNASRQRASCSQIEPFPTLISQAQVRSARPSMAGADRAVRGACRRTPRSLPYGTF